MDRNTMILIGAMARIKPAAKSKYMPDLNSEAVLDSVSFPTPALNSIPIRMLGTRKTVGVFYGGRQSFSISYSFRTSPQIAHTYFTKVIEDAAKFSGGIHYGFVPNFSDAAFVPVAVSEARWQYDGDNPASYTITLDYFNLDTQDATPLEQKVYEILAAEYEINLLSSESTKPPYSGESFQMSMPWSPLRTVDGYFGMKFDLATLTQSVTFFDNSYSHSFRYDPLVVTVSESLSQSSLMQNDVLTFIKNKSGVLVPSSAERGVLWQL